MKIKKIVLNNFKRFTNLVISDIPASAKLILLVGPNGCGKTSVLEAMNQWYTYRGFGILGARDYLEKNNNMNQTAQWNRQEADRAVNIDFFDPPGSTQIEIKGKFYFRTAYRNEPYFSVQTLSQLGNPADDKYSRDCTLIQNENNTVSKNYHRLVSNTMGGVYSTENDKMSVKNLREQLIGKVREAVKNVFPNLVLNSIGKNPLENGSFYFEKGISKNYHYKNLSAGEKSVFDLLLDIIIKSDFYTNTVFCIDEPEAHMHTSLQSDFLREMYNHIPDNSQLWISTHSLGMLNVAQEIEKKHPHEVVFLDLSDKDFDSETTIRPSKIDTALWKKFLECAIGHFANLVMPENIILCEGDPAGNSNKNFDAEVYNQIFASLHDTRFVSVGGKNDVEKNNLQESLKNIMRHVNFWKLVDRDDMSEYEINESVKKDIIPLGRRHIESYLYDDEIIKKLCDSKGMPDAIHDCIVAKHDALAKNKEDSKPDDHMKWASDLYYHKLRGILGLTQCGSRASDFAMGTLVPLITEETEVYKELEREIFSHIQNGKQD